MTTRIPQVQSAAYRAAALIHATGPIPRAELFTRIHFSTRPPNSAQILNAAITSGWLCEIPEGVTLTDRSREHFGSQEAPGKVKYVGQIAPLRTSSAYDRPPLSRKYIPNIHGTRNDIPDFSVRPAGYHFHALA
jgi:hypothetical protein